MIYEGQNVTSKYGADYVVQKIYATRVNGLWGSGNKPENVHFARKNLCSAGFVCRSEHNCCDVYIYVDDNPMRQFEVMTEWDSVCTDAKALVDMFPSWYGK